MNIFYIVIFHLLHDFSVIYYNKKLNIMLIIKNFYNRDFIRYFQISLKILWLLNKPLPFDSCITVLYNILLYIEILCNSQNIDACLRAKIFLMKSEEYLIKYLL